MKLVSANLYKALLRLIRATEADVAKELEKFLRKRNPTRKERMKKVAEMKATLRKLDAQVAHEAPRIISIAYDNAKKATVREPGVDQFPEDSNFSKVHREAVNLLTDNLINSLGEASATLGRRTEDAFRRHGLRTVTEQLTREQPEAVASGRMRKRLEDEGITAFVDKSGRKWDLTTYSNMVVRTSAAEAQAQATVNAMLSRGLDLVDVVHTERHHESTTSAICKEYEDKTFSLTGKTPGYPVLDRLPPFHPNCDHFLKPSRAGLGAMKIRDAA